MNAKQRQLLQVDYIEHILDATRQVHSYVEGVTKELFLQDRKTQDAVILKLLVITPIWVMPTPPRCNASRYSPPRSPVPSRPAG